MQAQRPLDGLTVGISISESGDMASRGLTSEEVNRTVITISEGLIAQGARLVFGHDWRPGGVMDTVFEFALAYTPGPGEENANRPPLITNFVPAPDRPTKPPEELALYSRTLRVEEPGPPALPEVLFARGKLDEAGEKVARVLSLTRMRECMTKVTDARICLGGRTTGSSGRCAGIVEEAFLTMQQGKALYLCGLFGGASAQVIGALTGMPPEKLDAFSPSDDVAEALAIAVPQERPADRMIQAFRDWGMAELSRHNRLSPEENLDMFNARQRDRVIDLLIKGLKRIKADRAGAP